jgi:hypothetical protein
MTSSQKSHSDKNKKIRKMSAGCEEKKKFRQDTYDEK